MSKMSKNPSVKSHRSSIVKSVKSTYNSPEHKEQKVRKSSIGKTPEAILFDMIKDG
jgi:hypothetical protein